MKLFLICLVVFCGFIVSDAGAKNYSDLNLVDLEILRIPSSILWF
jgi:hypothetical protein